MASIASMPVALPANFRAAAAMAPISPPSSAAAGGGADLFVRPAPLPLPLKSLAPTDLPAIPYHELSYDTLRDLLNHINSMHEDAEKIANVIQSHHTHIAYEMISDARKASSLSTALLLHDLKGINYWLKKDAHNRKSLRSGAQHMGFLTSPQLENLNEASVLIIAELKTERHALREGGAFLDEENEVEKFGDC